MPTNYPAQQSREIPPALKAVLVSNDYDANGVFTGQLPAAYATWSRRGDNFKSGNYNYTFQFADGPTGVWTHNYDGTNSPTGEPAPATMYIGYGDNQLPRGYDNLNSALAANWISRINTSLTRLSQGDTLLLARRVLYGNNARVTIDDTVTQQDDGAGGTYSITNSFSLECPAKLIDVLLAPTSDYPTKANAVIYLSLSGTLATALPLPADCAQIRGSVLGYKIESNSSLAGLAVYDSVLGDIASGGLVVVYLYGSSRIAGTLSGSVVVVPPPGTIIAFTGTTAAKQWVFPGYKYTLASRMYEWRGAITQLASLDTANTNWTVII